MAKPTFERRLDQADAHRIPGILRGVSRTLIKTLIRTPLNPIWSQNQHQILTELRPRPFLQAQALVPTEPGLHDALESSLNRNPSIASLCPRHDRVY